MWNEYGKDINKCFADLFNTRKHGLIILYIFSFNVDIYHTRNMFPCVTSAVYYGLHDGYKQISSSMIYLFSK